MFPTPAREALTPMVLGHEGSGVVTAVGSAVTGVRRGRARRPCYFQVRRRRASRRGGAGRVLGQAFARSPRGSAARSARNSPDPGRPAPPCARRHRPDHQGPGTRGGCRGSIACTASRATSRESRRRKQSATCAITSPNDRGGRSHACAHP
ncbi:alcohol dehydrogenase catalytic domain-containing protein [Streptomyces sp. NPDC049687]|uniref:alcohol dehydrogenase catalytic domain-containing protein n=1 Tax=Streptomyces sp. NPDC049687 TaxID=3365596 RepID=UPI0037A8CAC4